MNTSAPIGPGKITMSACPDCNKVLRHHPSWCDKTGKRHECPDNARPVKYVRADLHRGAVERLAEAERLLSGALEPGGMGNPVRCFSRGEMADIEMALAAIRGQ